MRIFWACLLLPPVSLVVELQSFEPAVLGQFVSRLHTGVLMCADCIPTPTIAEAAANAVAKYQAEQHPLIADKLIAETKVWAETYLHSGAAEANAQVAAAIIKFSAELKCSAILVPVVTFTSKLGAAWAYASGLGGKAISGSWTFLGNYSEDIIGISFVFCATFLLIIANVSTSGFTAEEQDTVAYVQFMTKPSYATIPTSREVDNYIAGLDKFVAIKKGLAPIYGDVYPASQAGLDARIEIEREMFPPGLAHWYIPLWTNNYG